MAFPSTFGDLQASVIGKVNLDATLDAQRVKDWLNQTYMQVIEETEANIVADTMTLTAGTYSYVLPPGICRIKSMWCGPQGSGDAKAPMVRTTIDDLLIRREGSPAGGTPTMFAVAGLSLFEVWPTPTAADVIVIYLVQLPAALAANGDTPILQEPFGSRLLELGALVHAGEFKGDGQTATWKAQYDEWMQKFNRHLEARGGDRPAHGHQWGRNAAC